MIEMDERGMAAERALDAFLGRVEVAAIAAAAGWVDPAGQVRVSQGLSTLERAISDHDPRGAKLLRELAGLFADVALANAAKSAPRPSVMRAKTEPPRPAPRRAPSPPPVPIRPEDLIAVPKIDLAEEMEHHRQREAALNDRLAEVQRQGEQQRAAQVAREQAGHQIAEEAEEAARSVEQGAARRAWRRLRG